MLEVTLLGTGGMMPLPKRFLTSLMLRYQGDYYLIDCGEGTQVAIRAAGWGFKQIGFIAFTHFHADHIAGLPGLLLTIGNAGRTQPLTIIGPAGVERVVESLRVIAPELPYTIAFAEIDEDGGEVCSIGDLRVEALPVPHRIPCFAYAIKLMRKGRFDAAKAKGLGIPVQYWSVLQNGGSVEAAGGMLCAKDVMGAERKGIKLCYATDLRPTKELAAFAAGADLFICEGNYGDPGKLDKAIAHRHCLFSEAAAMAREAGVGELWLTHFSPSMPDPSEWLEQATAVFPNAYVDRQRTVLRYP